MLFPRKHVPLSLEEQADFEALEARLLADEKLTHAETLTHDEYAQRLEYQSNIQLDREAARFGAYVDWPELTERGKKKNLPYKIASYEAAKKLVTTEQGTRIVANRHLEQHARDYEEVRNGIFYCQSGNEVIFLEVAAEVDAKFRNHVEADLAKLNQAEAPHSTKELAAEAFGQLFELRFTLAHCNALMAKVLVGPAYIKPTNLSAKIWALLHVLEEKNLLDCTAIEAAQAAGNYYGYQMAEKPSKVADGQPYKDASSKINKAVKEAIARKEYGPNYS